MAKILLIEDDARHSKEIHDALQKHGHEVMYVAGDLASALKHMDNYTAENKPDLIVTDNSFPFLLDAKDKHAGFFEGIKSLTSVGTGTALSKFIRDGKIPCIKDIPIVMQTSSYKSTLLQLAAAQIKIDRIVDKTPKKILAAIDDILRQKPGRKP
jgi:CheY-like chemotaxis protein